MNKGNGKRVPRSALYRRKEAPGTQFVAVGISHNEPRGDLAARRKKPRGHHPAWLHHRSPSEKKCRRRLPPPPRGRRPCPLLRSRSRRVP